MGRCTPQPDKIGQIDSDKVFYTGEYLANLGINTNTNLTTILTIIDTIFGNSSNFYIIKTISEQGNTITNPTLVGKQVELIVIAGLAKNSGFTKLLSSPTITFTDGTELMAGQTITIFAK